MGARAKAIQIVGVDKEGITPHPRSTDRYKFPFKLSRKPDGPWPAIFKLCFAATVPQSLKYGAHVSGDCIVLNVDAGEDIETLAETLKEIVATTNRTSVLFQAAEQACSKPPSPSADEAVSRLRGEADRLEF